MLPLIVYRRPIRRRIRIARPEDKPIVTEIANYAFAPKDRTVWINGAFGRSDRTIYVLEEYGKIEAFAITRPEGTTLRIDLIGTWKPRMGYCQNLLYFIELTSTPNFSEVVAGTHSDNKPAQAFYEAMYYKCSPSSKPA